MPFNISKRTSSARSTETGSRGRGGSIGVSSAWNCFWRLDVASSSGSRLLFDRAGDGSCDELAGVVVPKTLDFRGRVLTAREAREGVSRAWAMADVRGTLLSVGTRGNELSGRATRAREFLLMVATVLFSWLRKDCEPSSCQYGRLLRGEHWQNCTCCRSLHSRELTLWMHFEWMKVRERGWWKFVSCWRGRLRQE